MNIRRFARAREFLLFAILLSASIWGVAAPAAVLPHAAHAGRSASSPHQSVASTLFTVNSTADTSDAQCTNPCTLRTALSLAQPGDTIVFSALFLTPQTIGIASTLTIDKNVTITGTGANVLTLRATGTGYPIITVPTGTVVINFLAIANGNVSAADGGGAIRNVNGNLILKNILFTGNHSDTEGGAISNSGSLHVGGSAFSGNDSQYGGALFNNGIATVAETTFSGNTGLYGSAILSAGNGSLTVATVHLSNCTVAGSATGNSVVAMDSGLGNTGASVELTNTIVAYSGGPGLAKIGANSSVVSHGNNLASDNGGGFLNQSGDLINTDPRLSELGMHGGQTPTRLPAPNSPAIDAGSDSGIPFPPYDQRGVASPQGAHADIGAVELRKLVVNSSADPGDGVCDATCTLRDAIAAANADDTVVDDIVFSSLFNTAQVINLTAALPAIAGDLTISGPGAQLLNVRRDTGGDYIILTVGSGAVASLSGLTISNGKNSTGAGGILSNGTLTVTASTLSGNHSDFGGGAITSHGPLTISASTLSDNSAESGTPGDGFGGALVTLADATLRNCTITGNTSGGASGGLFAIANPGKTTNVSITNCTVAGNTGVGVSGALDASAGGTVIMTLENTIVSANMPANLSSEGGSQLVSLGHNLSSGNDGAFLNTISDYNNTDPLLTPLGYWGGTTPTLFPMRGSPAIDAGDANAPATDQRGVSRPQGVATDIGAVESDDALFRDGFE